MSIGQCGILSMIHTPIYPDLKRENSINVASFLYRGRVGYTNGVFIIDSIPHCTSGLETSKETKIKKSGFISIWRASREHQWRIYHRQYSTLSEWLKTMSIGQCVSKGVK